MENSIMENDPAATEKRFACDVCLMSFTRNCNLIRHCLKTHRPENQYRCMFCVRRFSTSDRLKAHLKGHAAPAEKRPVGCPSDVRAAAEMLRRCGPNGCGGDGKAKRQAAAPVAKKKPRHACDVCHKTFYRSNVMKFHRMMHDDDRSSRSR